MVYFYVEILLILEEKMDIKQRIIALQEKMKEKGITMYMVPSADFHQSEYVSDYFKGRAFITGFTGSAGTAIVTLSDAFLWTDGRYFIQAEKELKGSGITLCKMGEPGVPTIDEYLAQNLTSEDTLGLDGRVISVAQGKQFESITQKAKANFINDVDFIHDIWTDCTPLPAEPAFALSENYTGESTESKLARIREKVSASNATAHIVSALDDLCWIFNFRGNDVAYCPVVLAHTIIFEDTVSLYIEESKLPADVLANLKENNVTILPYNSIYEDLKNLDSTVRILLDPAKLNYSLYTSIPSEVKKVEDATPVAFMKACKNEVELENIRKAHIKDGVAITKFMHWLKKNIGKIEMDELSASAQLESFRKEQEGFLWPSFAPICAYGEHAAQCHYSSSKETNVPIEQKGLFLADTGGNYMEGSTDITRTTAMGPLRDVEILHFTTVARAMLTLMNVKFIYGTTGINLDFVARGVVNAIGANYNHGTGHGVGYLLSIHEGPQGIRGKVLGTESIALEPGMILTNEPGLYVDGSHGIRTENELIVREAEKNEFGQFLYFEPITFAPIDLDAIDPSLMSDIEKVYLNDYHQQVWDKISPHLNDEEKEWLKEYTRAI